MGHASCAAALLLSAAAPLTAQYTSATLDLSLARMRFADSMEATAISVTPVLRAAGDRYTLDAVGTFSRLGEGWSNSGSVNANAVAARLGRFNLDVGGMAGGSLHSEGTRTGQLLGSGAVRAGFESGAAWAGAGVGRTWDGQWQPLERLDFGAWLRRGANIVAATVQPSSVADSIRFTDSYFMLSREAGPWSIGATLGIRSGAQMPTLPANRKTWGNASAAFAFTPTLLVVTSAGTYPVDFTQGYPGGQYLSLGVRIRGAGDANGASLPVSAQPTRAVRDFRATLDGGLLRLQVLAPRAGLVELSGDLTSWKPVRLRHEGNGWWSVALPAAAGTYEINVRVDGGAWQVPPGTVPRADEFGVRTGILVVR